MSSTAGRNNVWDGGPASLTPRETYAPVWTWHIVGWLPISLLYVSGGGMNCVSCDICVYKYHLWFVCVLSLGYSSAPE